MEKQQVQLNRMVYIEEIPEEIERIFRRSMVMLTDVAGDPTIELLNILESKNYTLFIDKVHSLREYLSQIDSKLQDCYGISSSYVQLITNKHHTPEANSNTATDNRMENEELQLILENMQEQFKKAEDLREKLGNNDVQEG